PASQVKEMNKHTTTAMRRSESHPLTLAQLRARRDEIIRIAAEHDAHNVRVFGSVARGEAAAGSDVDILVDIATERHGFAYFGLLEDLRRALSAALGRDIDVVDGST